MVLLSKTIEPPKRYRSSSRKILADLQRRRPIRLKEKRVRRKKTSVEKKADQEKRQAEREDYLQARQAALEVIDEEARKLHARFGGHSEQWYKDDLLQIGRLKKEKRAVSRWNAFLHHESQKAHKENDGQWLKAHELAAAIKEKWNTMSSEEKIAVTYPLVAELEEHKANTKFGTHNVPLQAFGDATQCLQAIENYMIALHARTGTEMLVLACRSSTNAFLHSWSTYTSERVRDFSFHQFKMTAQELSMRMEAFCLAGVEGMVNKQISGTAELKTKLKDLINTSLQEVIGGKVRMTYIGFEERFTTHYGVLIEKWPLSRFCSPSELTRAEVDILLGAWNSGTTYFCKMPAEEWKKWQEDRLTALAETSASSDPSADRALSPSNPLNDTPTMSSTPTESPMEGIESSAPQSLGDATNIIGNAQTITPSGTIFINSTGPGTISPTIRKRKQRCDAGKKRGPRKENKASSLSVEAPGS
ncbi:hypothetical protein C0992_001057 [Termitomyces sp. T32_za158]|nr:hypothetical protein C0992_001057 [Termitomyces sp. T32_za158]